MIIKAKKKPVEIEAVQWTGINTEEIISFCGKSRFVFVDYSKPLPVLYIKTLEGEHKVTLSDYIIKGIKCEFYPCKEDIFLQTYDILN